MDASVKKTRLNIFCIGYARDSSAVAREAVKHAAEEGFDCVLIDTAGRMQVKSRTSQGVPRCGVVAGVWMPSFVQCHGTNSKCS